MELPKDALWPMRDFLQNREKGGGNKGHGTSHYVGDNIEGQKSSVDGVGFDDIDLDVGDVGQTEGGNFSQQAEQFSQIPSTSFETFGNEMYGSSGSFGQNENPSSETYGCSPAYNEHFNSDLNHDMPMFTNPNDSFDSHLPHDLSPLGSQSTERGQVDQSQSQDGQFQMSQDGQFQMSQDRHSQMSQDGQFQMSQDGHSQMSQDGQFQMSQVGQSHKNQDGQFQMSQDGHSQMSQIGRFQMSQDGHSQMSQDGHSQMSQVGQSHKNQDGKSYKSQDENLNNKNQSG
jgi:hypothetical protein